MKRKLILLNLVLVVLVAAAGWRLRVEWAAAKLHEQEVLGKRLPAAQPPPYQPLDAPKPVMPAQYIDVANKDLFSKERNPTVVIPPPPEPPPPPPMPKLPVLRGMLSFGGISAIMSVDGKTTPKEFKPGDKIGEFTLVSLSSQEIVLDWNGQQVSKLPEELMDHSIPQVEAAPGPAAAAAVGQQSTQITPQTQISKSGPGVDMGAGRKACINGDSTPPGTVVDGLKKVTWETPFGTGCAWEAPK